MKATFRLPEALLEELRERSRQEGRSLNATAIEALWRGLGRDHAGHEINTVLSSFMAKEAKAVYQPAEVERLSAQLGDGARHLADALEWTRGER